MKYRTGKRLAILVAAVLALSGLSAVGAQSASAVTCSGTGCNYKDPIATGCAAGAYTAAHALMSFDASKPGGYFADVQVRYSPACGTNWTRIVVTDGRYHNLNANITNMVHGWSAQYFAVTNTSMYTDMVYARTDLACGSGNLAYPNGPAYQVCA